MIENSPSGGESLREQVMIAQFQGATGCTRDQARQLLLAARWEFQTALSMFFQECTIQQHQQQQHPQHHQMAMSPMSPSAMSMATASGQQSMFAHPPCRMPGHLGGTACAPCNTPATPPSFPEALLALQKLQTGSGSVGGGADWSAAASPPMSSVWQQQQQAPKVLSMFNPMPPPSDR